MRWSVSGVGALVGVALLTGCSSTDVKDFREQANAACAATEKRMDEIPRASTPAQTAKAAEREIAIRQEAIDQLSELIVPMHIGGAIAVIKDLETRQERARAVKKAAERKQKAKLHELEAEGSREFGVEAQHAKDLGLDDCGGV